MEEINGKIEELRILESNIQNLISQRQNVQIEINEIENALAELEDYDDEIYKFVSGLLIKSKKEEVLKELKEKKKVAEMKISTFEKQEALLEEKIDEVKNKIYSLQKNKKN